MTPNERTKYQAKFAQKRRVDLLRLLAPDCRCSKCGTTFPIEELTVQHCEGASFKHHELNQHQRVARYWKEYKAGVKLEAMCGACNSGDGYRFWGKYTR